MKIKFNIILLFLVFALFSCEKHIDDIDTSLKIGNIYCSDGSAINPKKFVESGKKAIGVIFWVNPDDNSTGDRALALSLEDLNTVQWSAVNEKVTGVSSSETDFNGSSNTASLLSWGKDNEIETPAVTECVNYNPYNVYGWFLPSLAQAKEIHKRKNEIYESLNILGSNKFDGIWYWTSTQDGTGESNPIIFAFCISLVEGKATISDKSNIFAVRPILSIK